MADSAAPGAGSRDSRPTIVVGYDGSAAGRAAIAHAARRAGRDGHLVVVYGYGPPPDWLGTPDLAGILRNRQRLGQDVLNEILLEGPDALLAADFDTELSPDAPADAIRAAARRHGADEIVVGSRGFGRVRGALGSVSHELIHAADRPLVIVPASTRIADGQLST